jgi:hypothetical protein
LRNGCPRPVLPTCGQAPGAPGSQRSGGSRAVTAGSAGTALDGTWRLRDGPRPASQRKRRLKGRASGGSLARRLKAGRSHFRVLVCGPGVRRRPAAAACRRAPPGALERSGRPLGRARRAETRALSGLGSRETRVSARCGFPLPHTLCWDFLQLSDTFMKALVGV